MLSKYAAPARINAIRKGPSGALIEDFANELFRRGYAAIYGRRHVRSAEHILRWAGRRGLNTDDLDERAIKLFGAHLDRCRCGRYLCCDRMAVLAGARLFVAHLQGIEPATREPPPDPADPDLLKAFCAWMREHRGTSDGTLYNYSGPIRALIRHFGEDPSKLHARRLRQFVLKRRAGWASAKWCTTALRMLKVAPSRLELEQIDAPLVVGFLNHLETMRANRSSSRNIRLAAIKSFMHFMEYRVPSALEQIRRVLVIPLKKSDSRLVRHLTAAETRRFSMHPGQSIGRVSGTVGCCT